MFNQKNNKMKFNNNKTLDLLKYVDLMFVCVLYRIVILMRGVPGSGKSFISKLIKDKEQEMGGSARILSIDDYFMTEDDIDAKQMIYEYDAKMENTYTQYLLKSFKKTLLDNLYDCVIVDCKNTTLQYLTEFYMIAKTHSFEVRKIICFDFQYK